MQTSDATLIKDYLQGDQRAFEVLYARYRKPLYGYLNRLLERDAAVDDIYQKTWMKVIRNMKKYRENQKFSAWLFRIAHNCAMDFFRQRKKVDDMVIEVDDADVIPDAAGNPLRSMDREELTQALDAALPELPPEQREVFLLRQQGVPFREIAEIQKTSVNTALGRMRYAALKLQSLLADWQEQRELA